MPKGIFERTKKNPIDRFMRFVDKQKNGCWIYTGYKNKLGYGYFGISTGRSMLAHRFSYIHFNGNIPDNTELDHLCRNPSCVNPAHLEAVSHQENMARGITGLHMIKKSKSSTHCVNGHEFNEKTLYLHKGKYKQCRVCKNNHQIEQRRKMNKSIGLD